MRSGNATQLNRQESISLQAALFMQRVYGWMTLGLIITGISSFYIASSQSAINFIFGSSMSILLIFGVQLGIVFAIRPAMKSGGWQMGLLLFIVFSAFCRNASFHSFLTLQSPLFNFLLDPSGPPPKCQT